MSLLHYFAVILERDMALILYVFLENIYTLALRLFALAKIQSVCERTPCKNASLTIHSLKLQLDRCKTFRKEAHTLYETLCLVDSY